MAAADERFDRILLPSVGGHPQMMPGPGNSVRTIVAYRILADRLTEQDVPAIWYPEVRVTAIAVSFWILAARRGGAANQSTLQEAQTFYMPPGSAAGSSPESEKTR
jgi:hypothetical protein